MSKKSGDFFGDLAKSLGGELLSEVGKNRGFIDTGILAVNGIISGRLIGGGLPRASLAEVSGPESTGKSVFGTNCLRGAQKDGGIAAFLDAERAISKDFAIRASKVEPETLVVAYPETLERAFHKITNLITRVRQNSEYDGLPLLIVYDSIAVSPSEDEYAETTVDMETASEAEKSRAGVKKEQPGQRARICSRELRKLMPIVAENDATILFVNQLRSKIGVMWGSPTSFAGGGESLKYYCSTRLAMTSTKKIVEKENKRVLGMLTNFRNFKSRFCAPHQRADSVALNFTQGIDPFGGLLELLRQWGRVGGSNGNYTVNEPWAGGKTIKFKSTKERNTVPVNVLLDCPALVDATDPSQVQYYVDLYQDAIDAADCPDNMEEDLGDEQ